ncbi:MAG: RdgB/HAM1 family non-canonical purine NTP pyrophosphatase [Planctomycetota bacterium]|jgi:XTP/dITP diphosphohydrolase
MILVGSKNPHKLHEVREILEPYGLRAVIAVDLPDVVEDGATFAENAAKKALEFTQFLKAPCLADDSGLVIPALDGEPGLFSARYAGEDATDEDNLRKVLAELERRGIRDPEAYFVCNIAIAVPGLPPRVVAEAEGRVHGRIVHEPRGENGFGYDPIFLLPDLGRTTAELPPEEKNRLSHRAAALAKLAKKIPAILDELDR